MKNRIIYLDFLKFIAIFSVILGHSVQRTSADLFWEHPVWEAICTCNMPLFIFLSGFFFCSALKRDWKTVSIDKLRHLMVPALAAFAVETAIRIITDADSLTGIKAFVWSFIHSLWYLKCLMLCMLLVYPVCRIIHNDFAAAAVVTVAVLMIPGTAVVNFNFMLPMFCLGMLCGNHYETIDRHRIPLLIASAVIYFMLYPFWSGRLSCYVVPTGLFDGGTFDMQNFIITIYRLAIGMAGTMMFFLLAKPVWGRLSRWRRSSFISEAGRYTLGIYVLQSFCFEKLFMLLDIYIPIPLSYLVVPFIAIAEFALCYGLTRLICRSRVGAFLLMGESMKES